MTVANNVPKVTANGNGSATTFSFSPVLIYASGDLQVTLVAADGTETLLTEGVGSTNYTVVVSEYPGTGSITYPSTGATRLATGESLVMKRVLPLLQETDLENQGGYFPDTQETVFDRGIYIDQQQQEEIDRCVKVTLGSTIDPDQLIDSLIQSAADAEQAATDAEAARVAAQAAEAAAEAAAASLVLPLDVAEGGTGATTAAGARTNLGLGTAATTNIGTSAGDVPALQTGGKMPAVSAEDMPFTGQLIGIQTISATGTYTKGSESYIVVVVDGGGGGGGGTGATSTGQLAVAAGGGSGGRSIKKILASALAASETVTVGAKGQGGVGQNNGGNGGTTSFGAHCQATGGGGGPLGGPSSSSIGQIGGVPGVGSGGDINLTGFYGGPGIGFGGNYALGGAGAPSHLGGGTNVTRDNNGPAGASPGSGGGGGGGEASSGARNGGDGKDGQVIVYKYK